MKNRPKSSADKGTDKQWDSASDITVERFGALLKKIPPKGAKKKPSTFLSRSNLSAKSATVLKGYCGLTLESDGISSSSDAFFKKSLRRYDDFETPTPKTSEKPKRAKTAKSKKQQVSQQGEVRRSARFISASDTSLATPRVTRAHEFDDDADVFYSPDSCHLYASGDINFHSTREDPEQNNASEEKPKVTESNNQHTHSVKHKEGKHKELDSQLFHSNNKQTTNVIEEVERIVTYTTEMADTEGDNPPPADEAPADDPDDDPVAQTEKLVEESTQELAKLEKELEDNDVPPDEQAVLKEVEECETQCMEIYKILSELKDRVTELLSKSSRTPQEEQELEAKQKLLNDKMALLEQKTRRIELLVGKTKKQDFNKFYDEDTLPKVVVCGLAENNMPKFIICDDKKRRSSRKQGCSPLTGPAKGCPNANLPPQPFQAPCIGAQGGARGGRDMGQGYPRSSARMQAYPNEGMNEQMQPVTMRAMPQFAKRLSESYDMQERLAQENADLEGKRYQLQEDLLCKEQSLDSLQRQLQCMQQELRHVVKENGLLNCKLQQIQESTKKDPCEPMPSLPCPPCQMPRPPGGDKESPRRQPCGPGKGPCPADENEETKKLEKQLCLMEMEVKAIQNELTTVRQERLHLEQHRRMLAPMTCPPPCGSPCMPPCPPRTDAQVREMREKYNCLQDDYKSKLTEVAGLRADVDKFKANLQEAAEYRKTNEEKIKELEKIIRELKDPKTSLTKENLMEMEQQLQVAKQRFREAQDEMDELRALTEEQQTQLKDYRNKYLEAQQQVEEQKRQMDLMELENSRIGEQVNLEIQRVKNQFQEKLQELTPLPDILKATQLKLQEAQQMHLMAERNNEALLREIQNLRDKAVMAVEQMEANKSGLGNLDAERQSLQDANEEMERHAQLLQAENDDLRREMDRMHDEVEDAEKRAQEKLHEIAQLSAEVENVRDESARQVARVKDRCETVRRSMQNQICDLEKQLAQSRAQAKSAQRDRDDIRQKMQSQITNLNDNFEDAQMRIRTLQGHVNFLKSSAAVYPSMDQLAPNRNC